MVGRQPHYERNSLTLGGGFPYRVKPGTDPGTDPGSDRRAERYSKSSARSSAGAECVRAPTEIQSTPAWAMARTVSRFTPPEASVVARLRTSSTQPAISAGDM